MPRDSIDAAKIGTTYAETKSENSKSVDPGRSSAASQPRHEEDDRSGIAASCSGPMRGLQRLRGQKETQRRKGP
jgi:hypothetical protein